MLLSECWREREWERKRNNWERVYVCGGRERERRKKNFECEKSSSEERKKTVKIFIQKCFEKRTRCQILHKFYRDIEKHHYHPLFQHDKRLFRGRLQIKTVSFIWTNKSSDIEENFLLCLLDHFPCEWILLIAIVCLSLVNEISIFDFW